MLQNFIIDNSKNNPLYLNDRHEEADTSSEDRRKLYDKRILPLLGEKDAAVFGETIDPDLWQYYRNLGVASILPKNIFYAKNYLDYPSLTKAVLADKKLVAELKQKNFSCLIPYIESESTEILSEEIGTKLLRSADLTDKLNNKSFYREVIEGLGFPMIPGYTVTSFIEAGGKFRTLQAEGFKRVVLKKERSVSGFGVFIIEDVEELQKIIEQNFSEKQSFLLEGFVEDIEFSPNTQYFIRPEKIDFIILTDQLLEKDQVSYSGNHFPSGIRLKSDILSRIEDLSLRFCRYLQKKKCYGIVGIDFLLTKKGGIYSTEANVRFNGSTFPALIAEELFGREPNIYWLFKTFRFRKPLSFENLLNKFGCFIKKKGEYGILPVGVDLLGSTGEGQFMIIAENRDKLDNLHKEFQDLEL